MGLERSYQAIPGDSDLVQRARVEPCLGEWLSLVCIWFRQGSNPYAGPSSPESLELRQIVQQLVAAEPELARRNYDLDKRWDQIHYLLSGRCRGERMETDDALFDVAIEGEGKIADHVCGSQGVPVRYTSPGKVADVAEAMQRIDLEILKQHYDLAMMEQKGIYKAFAGRESEDDWEYLSKLVRGLSAFYLDAAVHGNGVLVCTD
jgi:hypothetical protein